MDDGQKTCGCGAGCATFGECLRGKNLMVGSRAGELYRAKAKKLLSGDHPVAREVLADHS